MIQLNWFHRTATSQHVIHLNYCNLSVILSRKNGVPWDKAQNQQHTSAFPWNSHWTTGCSRSVLCVLPHFITQSTKKAHTERGRLIIFTASSRIFWSKIGCFFSLFLTASAWHCRMWLLVQYGIPTLIYAKPQAILPPLLVYHQCEY